MCATGNIFRETNIETNKHKTNKLKRLSLIAGITLIGFSTTVQFLVTIRAWRQERINKWSVEMPLDMSSTYTYAKYFTPETQYYSCFARFSMRGPVTEQFADYRSFGGGNVPDDLIRNIFSQMPFKVSWQILDGEKDICSGVFLSSDINVFVYPNYVLYTYSRYSQKGPGNLEPFREYLFIGNVEMPCESLNELNPTLEFRSEANKNMLRAIAKRTLIMSVPAFLLGVILLIRFAKNSTAK
jgi:hypothetical protein